MKALAWILGLVVVCVLMGSVVYKLATAPDRPTSEPVDEGPGTVTAPPIEVPSVPRGRPLPDEAPDVDEPEDPDADIEVDPEFARRMVHDVPLELHERAGSCYDPDIGRNAEWTLSARVRFRTGEVTFDEVRVTEKNVDEPSVERCLMDAVYNARWADQTAPEGYQDTIELDFSQRALRKFAPRDDDGDEPIESMKPPPITPE